MGEKRRRKEVDVQTTDDHVSIIHSKYRSDFTFREKISPTMSRVRFRHSLMNLLCVKYSPTSPIKLWFNIKLIATELLMPFELNCWMVT